MRSLKLHIRSSLVPASGSNAKNVHVEWEELDPVSVFPVDSFQGTEFSCDPRHLQFLLLLLLAVGRLLSIQKKIHIKSIQYQIVKNYVIELIDR